jgi:hypothetical protein
VLQSIAHADSFPESLALATMGGIPQELGSLLSAKRHTHIPAVGALSRLIDAADPFVPALCHTKVLRERVLPRSIRIATFLTFAPSKS